MIIEMELKDVLGLWRHVNGAIITDFNIRYYDRSTGKGLSFFTIYGKDKAGNEINYEWQGAVVGLNENGDTTYAIEIQKLNYTEDKPEYQNLKVWLLADKIMTLELGNGDKVNFDRLH